MQEKINLIEAKQFLSAATDMKDELIKIRRTLHQNPETGRNLPRTQKLIIEKLIKYGYEPQAFNEGGVTAVISNEREFTPQESKKTFLLRADMDALAVKEKTKLSFRAKNGNMHACGHDMHAAMLLGAAKLLRQYESELNGNVKLVFQPDEEGFKGAKSMIAAGVLNAPNVNAAMALHVHSGTPSGMILCGTGTCMAGCTVFRITVKGKGCHGAMPETGADSVTAAAHIHCALQEIAAREVSAKDALVITVGKFTAGEAPNVIPQEAVLEGTIRALDEKTGEFAFRRVREIAESTANAFRCKAIVSETASVPPLFNDPVTVNELSGYARALAGEKAVFSFSEGGMGSEDFSSYTQKIPCAYLLIGAGAKTENELFGEPMHNEKVIFNEDILPLGAALYAFSAINWLKKH